MPIYLCVDHYLKRYFFLTSNKKNESHHYKHGFFKPNHGLNNT